MCRVAGVVPDIFFDWTGVDLKRALQRRKFEPLVASSGALMGLSKSILLITNRLTWFIQPEKKKRVRWWQAIHSMELGNIAHSNAVGMQFG